MPPFTSAKPGAPVWIDLTTSDRDAAIAFYTAVFDWDIDDENFADTGYTFFLMDGHRVAGVIAGVAPHRPDAWNIYLSTPNADVVAARVEEAGGRLDASMVLGGTGAVLHVIDPGGAWIGGWQAGSHAGFSITNEPGAPAWFELHTRDYDEALAFYTTVFGWEPTIFSDTPEYRYATLGGEGAWSAGIWDATAILADGKASRWNVYFSVADADATVLAAHEAGGTTLEPAKDSGFGRVAELADPQGARFFIIREPDAG